LTFAAHDVVVLAMKSQDTTNALDALAPLTPVDLPIVCAQNGVENERRTLRRYANVHGMCVMMASVYLEPASCTCTIRNSVRVATSAAFRTVTTHSIRQSPPIWKPRAFAAARVTT